MRILHCLRAPVGGLFRHVLDLAAEQARLGHDVGIIADSNAEDRLTAARFDAIRPLLTLGVCRTPMKRGAGIGDVASATTIYRHAVPLSLDVLHGHGAKGGAYARIASRVLQRLEKPVKAFYTPHGGTLNFAPGTVEAKIYLGLERLLERSSSGLIFESQFAADAYRRHVGAPRVPFRVIHNGLKADDFVVASSNPDASDVLFIGELRDLKGVDVLLRALATSRNGPKLTATIVGAGPDGEKLHRLADELVLRDRVRFAGALPASEAFKLGRVLAVPSLKESFPYVVLEAAAAGIPLIATAVGGIPEIVADTDTSLVAAGSVDELASALDMVVRDPGAARDRAGRLRANVQRKFTVTKMAREVVAFYANPAGLT